MSNSQGERSPDPSEADRIQQSLTALREQIVEAWSERAVLLTHAEQKRLQREIHKTCEMLTALTRLT
jgi:hypothetical protein